MKIFCDNVLKEHKDGEVDPEVQNTNIKQNTRVVFFGFHFLTCSKMLFFLMMFSKLILIFLLLCIIKRFFVYFLDYYFETIIACHQR